MRDADDAHRDDALRAVWRGLEPPEPGGDLESTDPGTREVVAWMRAAWATVEAPPARAPRQSRTPRALFVAGAAALASAAAWILWLGPPSVQREAPDELGAALAPRRLAVAAVTPDRVELRSGPVRLILLTPSDEQTESVLPPSGDSR